ncbi:MAG: FAD/NAD(P)-binding protein [Acidimicrobiales bacterium]|jgi:uncharacterized NAD(P)/FAD-binding protein YdhS
MGTSTADVAIIGGGASGTLVAAHILREASSPYHIALIERSGRMGEGIAYSTGSECHLLNVPARYMSAFEDDPEHFVRWLAVQGLPAATAHPPPPSKPFTPAPSTWSSVRTAPRLPSTTATPSPPGPWCSPPG